MNQNAVLKVKSVNILRIFEWLSQSVAIVSQSVPGEKISVQNLEEFNFRNRIILHGLNWEICQVLMVIGTRALFH